MHSGHGIGDLRALASTDESGPPRWMSNLERAHDRLRRASRLLEEVAKPVIDLEPTARSLVSAFEAIYVAYDAREERLGTTRKALAHVDTAVAELGGGRADAAIAHAIELLEEARVSLAEAVERVAPLVPTLPPVARDLRASLDVPGLHAIDRPVLRPVIRVPPFVPVAGPIEHHARIAPRTFKELDAAVEQMKRRVDDRRQASEAQGARARELPPSVELDRVVSPPGFVLELPKKVAPLVQLAQRARECFEEVAMLGMQRAPLLGDPWRNSMFLERRMLSCLDAIVALGPHALAQLEPWVRDAPAKDPSRVFAIAMVLGCVEGRDGIAAAERMFLATQQSDPSVAAYFGGALKLATHPDLPVVLRAALEDGDPGYRAVAIDVLGYRGWATPEELARAAIDAEPAIAAAALPHYAVTQHPGVRAAIDAALEKDDDALRLAAWHAMAMSGHPHAAAQVAAALGGPQQEWAALTLALVGTDRDAQLLLDRATATPVRPLITAVGWAGRADAIVPLMSFLAHEDDAVKLAAAYALDRITGAGLYETIEVEPDEILVPDVPDPDVGGLGGRKGPELARTVSDPRDLPGKGAPDSVDRPTVDVRRWKAYWVDSEKSYQPTQRYRRGRPYTPLVSLEELDRWPATPGERRSLQRELVIRTRSHVHLDPHDFIVMQEKAIADWRPIARSASGAPGTWNLPTRR